MSSRSPSPPSKTCGLAPYHHYIRPLPITDATDVQDLCVSLPLDAQLVCDPSCLVHRCSHSSILSICLMIQILLRSSNDMPVEAAIAGRRLAPAPWQNHGLCEDQVMRLSLATAPWNDHRFVQMDRPPWVHVGGSASRGLCRRISLLGTIHVVILPSGGTLPLEDRS